MISMTNAMRFLYGLRKSFQVFVTAAFLAAATACASVPRLVEHSFEFDARRDSLDIEILDYRYGASNFPGVRGCPKQYAPCETSRQYAGTYGEMLVGDDLFVKWRIKSTGGVHEDTVDLRNRLPENMHRRRIRFDISGPQLYVFVINLDSKIDPNPCPIQEERHRLDHSPMPPDRVFSRYCSKSIIQIYPDQPVSQKSK